MSTVNAYIVSSGWQLSAVPTSTLTYSNCDVYAVGATGYQIVYPYYLTNDGGLIFDKTTGQLKCRKVFANWTETSTLIGTFTLPNGNREEAIDSETPNNVDDTTLRPTDDADAKNKAGTWQGGFAWCYTWISQNYYCNKTRPSTITTLHEPISTGGEAQINGRVTTRDSYGICCSDTSNNQTIETNVVDSDYHYFYITGISGQSSTSYWDDYPRWASGDDFPVTSGVQNVYWDTSTNPSTPCIRFWNTQHGNTEEEIIPMAQATTNPIKLHNTIFKITSLRLWSVSGGNWTLIRSIVDDE